MKKIIFLLLLLPIFLPAQDTTSRQKNTSLGFYFSQDMMWNQTDKILTGYMARKSFFGLNVKNEKTQLSFFVGVGTKGFKFQFWTPAFTQEFMNDFAAAYHPVSTHFVSLKDSLVGAALNEHATTNGKKNNLFGTYTFHAQAGLRYHGRWLQPSVAYHIYSEVFPFYSSSFGRLREAEVDWLALNSSCHEIRWGLSILPFFGDPDLNFSFSLEAGYKWVKFDPINIDRVKLVGFTNQDFADKYAHSQKWTYGITFSLWLN